MKTVRAVLRTKKRSFHKYGRILAIKMQIYLISLQKHKAQKLINTSQEYSLTEFILKIKLA